MKEKLKQLRKEIGKTQKDVAEALKISRTTFSNYEQGVAEPDIKTIIKLAQYFKTTTDNILSNQTPYLLDKSTLSEEQQELFELIKHLSNDNCKRVKDFIAGIMIAEEEKQKIINLYKRSE